MYFVSFLLFGGYNFSIFEHFESFRRLICLIYTYLHRRVGLKWLKSLCKLGRDLWSDQGYFELLDIKCLYFVHSGTCRLSQVDSFDLSGHTYRNMFTWSKYGQRCYGGTQVRVGNEIKEKRGHRGR